MMDARAHAQQLADLVAEAQDRAAASVWKTLRPLIVRSWTAAYRPSTVPAHAVTAAVDDTALAHIAARWATPQTAIDLAAEMHSEGALAALVGYFGSEEAIPDEVQAALSSAVYDPVAVRYMGEATNRLQGIGQSAWKEARSTLTNAMATTTTREQAKQQLEDVLDVSEFRADTIARTEMASAANAGVAYGGDTLAAAGYATTKTWFAQMDARTRETHADADGQSVPMNEPFEVGGYELDFPGDPSGPPEEVINCRCTMMLETAEGEVEADVDELAFDEA